MHPQNTQVVAHRANGYGHPENTLPAFQAAAAADIDGVELDVWLSRDRIPVVVHDPTMHIAGKERHMTKLTHHNMDPRPPQLDNVLEVLAACRFVNVELKRSRARLDPALTHLAAPHICTSSFSWPMLKTVRLHLPQARLALLLGPGTPLGLALVRARQLDCEALHLSLEQLHPVWIRRIRQAGLAVRVYTANTAVQWRRCAELHVDAIMTDRPRALKQWLTNSP